MANRSQRARIAAETVEILEAGRYTAPTGATVSLSPSLETAVRGTVLYRPDDFENVLSERERVLSKAARHETQYDTTNETTLSAARRLAEQGDVLALNFASAKNPGGGFLGGSQAQEESLARAGGLYPCLMSVSEYYEVNRNCRTCLYTDHVIYSPRVPVFRDDDDRLLESPYPLSIITSPAVNAGCVRAQEPRNVERIATTMMRRIESVLSIAVIQGHDTLVLGAWGCGVFKNDPKEVARWFDDVLNCSAMWGVFRQVVFAVLDKTEGTVILGPFEERFGR